MACAALEALLAKAIWVDLVGSNPPASHSVWLPEEGIESARPNFQVSIIEIQTRLKITLRVRTSQRSLNFGAPPSLPTLADYLRDIPVRRNPCGARCNYYYPHFLLNLC